MNGRPGHDATDPPRGQICGVSRRQSRAPEVTREWPADGPAPRPPTRPWPLVLMANLLALVALGLAPGLATPAGLAASLTALSALALRMSLMTEDPADRALQRAQRAIWLDEDPRGIVVRLRGVGLRGRPRRDIAVRCLDGARKCHLQKRVLRMEASIIRSVLADLVTNQILLGIKIGNRDRVWIKSATKRH